MDINSRVGNHVENMERAQAGGLEHQKRFRQNHPNFDYDGSDFCHCTVGQVTATLEFDGFLRLTHVGCGKILMDGDYLGELYMAPVQVVLQPGTMDNGENYAVMQPVQAPLHVKSSFLKERDCEA